ncbi:MAG: hypothetical protein ABSF49_00375 [Roseiarcus sp.]|uniref:hypothetical protein n=1 Tax=Roseiarcus sp. TaxID=1969460 RepID=UPI003C1839A9
MSDSQPTSGDSPRVEPSFDGDPAPSVDPPRLELLPYALTDRAPPRAGLSRAVVWASSLAAGLALIAGVAAAALYDHARETNLIAAKSEETRSLAQTVKTLKDRIDAIEAARTRDESADMRKIAAEMKGESAGVRDLSANLGQTNARIDKLERDHGARLDKLADRFDHETAGKLADLSGRLDKLEKRPVAAAPVAPAPPAKPVPAAAMVSNETTGSIDRPKLRGYWLVEADEGYAVIDGRDGPQQVAPGDVLPGIGRVQRIERRGRDWVVVTSAGVIAGDQPAF